MMYMGAAGDRGGGWPERGRRFAASGRAPAVAGALLGLAAMTEAITRGAGAAMSVASLAGVSALALFTTVPLAFLGPVAAAVAICAASVLSVTAFQTLTAAGLIAQLIVVYRLGRSGAAWSSSRRTEASWGAAQFLAPAAALTGIAQRARSEALVHSHARQVIAGTLVEHTARGERARIARELHDVVAHHISMIAVQAETARLATPGMPAAGAQRLLEIGDTARAGLTEMRRLLGVLREDAQAAGPGLHDADRRPQPGLQQLNELLDEARDASGAGTRLIVSGPPATLDPGVELAAYRIIQEALTNARRHAPGAAVDVELHFADDALRLRIRDNGPGPPAPQPAAAGGHGLPGMRERAAAAGGELRTGAAPGGGFLIEATLPAKAELTS